MSGYVIEYEEGFEPYVIVSRQDNNVFCLSFAAQLSYRWLVPPYDERYEGYGRCEASEAGAADADHDNAGTKYRTFVVWPCKAFSSGCFLLCIQ
eukprot:757018-Hanusia_phi.AAC.4